MNALGKQTIKIGITVGLSLGAIIGLIGCSDQSTEESGGTLAAVESENGLSMNGLSMNGLSMNGLSMNGLSMNGLSMNGLSMNGLAASNGLSAANGLMTTDGGRQIVKYMVKCALPQGQSFSHQDQYGNWYTYQGAIGVAPAALGTGTCDLDCQESLSACLMAHVNNSGLHVAIWLDGPDSAIGWGANSSYPYMEGTYFGNLIQGGQSAFNGLGWVGNYCTGPLMGAGEAAGRLGPPIGQASTVFNPVYGSQNGLSVPCAGYCSGGTSDGPATCSDSNYNQLHLYNGSTVHGSQPNGNWKHPITVWRNFEATQMYKICNKTNASECLGVVGGSTAAGAKVEIRTFSGATGAAGQTWQILQVGSNPPTYKFINVTSGMAMDVSGAQVVQNPYSGASSQQIPMNYVTGDPGRAFLAAAANTNAHFQPTNGTLSDGTLVQNTGSTADVAKWSFTSVGLAPTGTVSDNAQYNFEGSTQGWAVGAAPATSVTNSSTVAFAGTQALAVSMNGAAGTSQVQVASPSTPAGKTVTFNIYIPSGAPVSSVQPYVQQSGNWTWTGNWQSSSAIHFGAWTTLTVAVPSNATALSSLGVQVSTSSTWTGTVYVDSISW
jgi:hypothetical protein